ncbi:MAG: NAD(P)/FAD-dependent oxidoreductase [Chitinispirillaceae bacterium]|nr:NAD(P)/FAD-dependent oxidoreductase [Chitinispirillaceae bacterium]
MPKTILIIGAGPAGLCAGRELGIKTNENIIICDINSIVGGLSRTENYKGNRIDIGGHRFFSKSEKVMNWWFSILPLQGHPSKDDIRLKRKINLAEGGPDPEKSDTVFLSRSRLSRILYLRRLFPYPIDLSLRTLRILGWRRVALIGITYLRARMVPRKPERNLEDFLVNRFGSALYSMFFRDYTQKVWGVPCREISSEWGRQRIKGLSILKALRHAVHSRIKKDRSLQQRHIETSLINNYLYPKLGPGQLWEEVASRLVEKGISIRLGCEVMRMTVSGGRISEVTFTDLKNGNSEAVAVDCVFSSMPVKKLIHALGDHPPANVKEVAEGLVYRDFITVGILLKKMRSPEERSGDTFLPDNWIYVQESDVLLGRIQIFNNWSPYMVAYEGGVWIGLEYFCTKGDGFWSKEDKEIIEKAVEELNMLSLASGEDVLDAVVIRAPYAYPAYFGTYSRFSEIRSYTDTIENLYLIGRSGMHRYNNTDHSMLSAMAAVDLYLRGEVSREAIWDVNAEREYHESHSTTAAILPTGRSRRTGRRAGEAVVPLTKRVRKGAPLGG